MQNEFWSLLSRKTELRGRLLCSVTLQPGECFTLYDEDAPIGQQQVDAICYGGIIDQHRFHPEQKFCGEDGHQYGPETRGLLQRRNVQIGRKVPIRKESNRRRQEGENLSVLQA